MGEWASSNDQSHPPCVLCYNRENRKSVDDSVINNGLTISAKHVSQHLAQRKNVSADRVSVSTIELTLTK